MCPDKPHRLSVWRHERDVATCVSQLRATQSVSTMRPVTIHLDLRPHSPLSHPERYSAMNVDVADNCPLLCLPIISPKSDLDCMS